MQDSLLYNKKMKNLDLKSKYDKVWSNNAYKNFYSTPGDFEHTIEIANFIPDWKNLSVVDIGCGEGDLASIIKSAGAKSVLGIDFSEEAIRIAKCKYNIPGLDFESVDYKNLEQDKVFDVIVMKGTLEHFDKPFEELDYLIKNRLMDGGSVVTSSPSFLNLRGHIWMTLQLLFDVPMSLTDLHFLCPFDFEEFCRQNNYELEYKPVAQDQGCGDSLITDFNKRLRNALKDRGMEGNVDKLLEWLEKAIQYKQYDLYTGAHQIYKINKKNHE